MSTERSRGRRSGAEPVLPAIERRTIAWTSEPALIAEQELAMERRRVDGRRGGVDRLPYRCGRRRRGGNGPGARGSQRGQEREHEASDPGDEDCGPSRHSGGAAANCLRGSAAPRLRGYTDARYISNYDRSLRWPCVQHVPHSHGCHSGRFHAAGGAAAGAAGDAPGRDAWRTRRGTRRRPRRAAGQVSRGRRRPPGDVPPARPERERGRGRARRQPSADAEGRAGRVERDDRRPRSRLLHLRARGRRHLGQRPGEPSGADVVRQLPVDVRGARA